MNRVGEKLDAVADAAHRELGVLMDMLPADQQSRGALLYELIALAKIAAPLLRNEDDRDAK